MIPLVSLPFVARLPFEERMQVLLEWFVYCVIAFVVVLLLVWHLSRSGRSLKRASIRDLRRMLASGAIEHGQYEREVKRRARRGESAPHDE